MDVLLVESIMEIRTVKRPATATGVINMRSEW